MWHLWQTYLTFKIKKKMLFFYLWSACDTHIKRHGFQSGSCSCHLDFLNQKLLRIFLFVFNENEVYLLWKELCLNRNKIMCICTFRVLKKCSDLWGGGSPEAAFQRSKRQCCSDITCERKKVKTAPPFTFRVIVDGGSRVLDLDRHCPLI